MRTLCFAYVESHPDPVRLLVMVQALPIAHNATSCVDVSGTRSAAGATLRRLQQREDVPLSELVATNTPIPQTESESLHLPKARFLVFTGYAFLPTGLWRRILSSEAKVSWTPGAEEGVEASAVRVHTECPHQYATDTVSLASCTSRMSESLVFKAGDVGNILNDFFPGTKDNSSPCNARCPSSGGTPPSLYLRMVT